MDRRIVAEMGRQKACKAIERRSTKIIGEATIQKFRTGRENRREMGWASDEFESLRDSFDIPCRVHRHQRPLMEESGDDYGGIGIIKFFKGKNIFITGATGFLGKVLVEKILRSTSVGKIYVLIRAKSKEAALDRLTKEIINSELFKCLQEKHGKSYASFVREKLIPIAGNISEPNLGMDNNSVSLIMKEVDVIIESAASTNINDRYDLLIDSNANAPQRLMRFAKSCKKLKLFAHISTAFVHGKREGLILEEPLTMGEDMRNKEDENSLCSFPRLDLGDELWLLMRSSQDRSVDVTKYLKKLGLERAKLYGWHNAYQMTKAMGEMVINEIKGDVPTLIIRPSIIESCYQDPFPGWIEGYRVADPVILSFGKGQLPAYLADPQTTLDIVPMDMVTNTIIAAIAKHGNSEKPESKVYHVASGDNNPLRIGHLFDIIYDYFVSRPLVNSKSESNEIRRIKFFNNMNDLSEYTQRKIWERHQLRNDCAVDTDDKAVEKHCKARVAYAEQLCKIYEFTGFMKSRLHTGNTQKLLREMSKEELLNFEIDVTKIDWRKYLQEVHIPGLIKHVLNHHNNMSS
ncbi:fatty acyl-CoA reductase 2, chloroplastic-like [Henckelia pumila]|uniref:fatty acyl-CoA reductase 2, chloroplastic-like n=1 Tax=Henckelia pumila TaxID=405737 RepID=UPI003C6E7AB8